MNVTPRVRQARAHEEYNQALAALPELRERRRMALARLRGASEGPSITTCRDARIELQQAQGALDQANELVRNKLAAWKAIMGIPQVGRDRSGRSPTRVETIQQRQDRLNAQVRKKQRRGVYHQEKFAQELALKDPHANLRGALQYLFREAFGVPCQGVTVESGDHYTITLRGAEGRVVTLGGATSELAAYLRCIHHLTQLLEIPAGSATICNSRDWDNGSWVVLSRPRPNQPQGYRYLVTLRYVKAQQEYLRLTGVHADPDPAYLPNTAPLKP